MDFANYWFSSAAGGGGYEIGNSLRFRGAQYLNRPVLTQDPTNGELGTTSQWVKLDQNRNGGDAIILQANRSGLSYSLYHERNTPTYKFVQLGVFGGTNPSKRGDNLYRDYSGWYHILTQYDCRLGTNVDTGFRMWVNGEEVTQNSSAGGWSVQNGWAITDRPTPTCQYGRDGSAYFSGYMAECHVVDGTLYGPETFGEYNADGVWVPIEVTGVNYGNNGWYLDFSDPANIGADRSGNGINFTATNFELTNTSSRLYDWMTDSPTNNFTILNPLERSSYIVPLEANIYSNNPNQAYRGVRPSQRFPRTGKFYWEGQFTPSNPQVWDMGIGDALQTMAANEGRNANFYDNKNQCYVNSSRDGQSYLSPSTASDIHQFAYDADTRQAWLGRNNTWYRTVTTSAPAVGDGDPANGLNETDLLPAQADHYYFPYGYQYQNDSIWNFGQRPFAYTPPAGFEPLSTAGMPNVGVTDPSDHFQTILSENPPLYPEPAERGAAYGGGFYAGRIKDGNSVYNIIVAPATSGNLTGEFPGTTAWDRYASAKPLAYSETYGGTATFAYGNGGNNSFVFDWAAHTSTGPNAGTVDQTNQTGTGIGGYNDWYVPAYKELELLYRTFKPTTDANNTNVGANDAAVPPTGNYTSTDPTQTSTTSFQSGNANALFANPQPGQGGWYWSATQSPSNPAVGYVRQMRNGTTDGQNVQTSSGNKVRAIRREFAYDAGILDYAQDTFPNGLWWIKDRVNNTDHQLVDSVRGGNLALPCPNLNPEGAYVAPTGSSVAWAWSVDGAPVINNDGTIQTQIATNVTAGFCIGTFTGNLTNSTLGHGLDRAPEFMIFRDRDVANETVVYHTSLGPTKGLKLNRSSGEFVDATAWNSTAPTDSVIHVGTGNATNQNGPMVFYAWHSVPGYSAFGSYVGKGGTTLDYETPFIYTGHRPAFVLIKNATTSETHWWVRDIERDTYNPATKTLYPSLTTPEQNLTVQSIDILSNGFKIRTNWDYANTSGDTYIWASFAEYPFGGGNVNPSPAR